MKNISKPDFLIERGDAPVFIFETFECKMQDPADIEVRNAFMKQSRNRIVTTKGRDDYLNEITFRLSGKKLPADATPMQRAEAMNQVLNDKKTKLRFIFSIWPRQPNPDAEPGHPPYRDMTPKNSFLGKMTPNGNQFWAATLFDFYFVQRFHDQPELRSISTASKLVQWAKANGETDGPTKVSIQWAEDEKDPELIPPYDIRLLIEHWEEIRRRVIASQIELEGKLKLDEWALPEEWPPESVFSPEAYPKGWATAAADESYGVQSLPVLQHYIPQHRLPKRLVVHDPSDVLQCRQYRKSQDKKKVTHYKLKLSEGYTDRRKADEEKEAEEQARAKKTLELFLANPHSSLEPPDGFEMIDLREPGWTKPAVFVVFPTRPTLKRPEVAHLHLSSDNLIGEGNHSCVYNAKMIVPRSWLVDEVMCRDCVKLDVKKILEEEDGPHGERRLKIWDEKTGMVVRHEIRKRPVSTVEDWDDIGPVVYEMQEAVVRDIMEYEGPYRVVHTRIKYQNLERGPLCRHLSNGMAHYHPLATKVRLAAKLTIEEDLYMLRREADNYQRFPKHFFEHWSGYNVCCPMHEPVPAGPLVPQFYGYYIPEDDSSTYKSPILLMEKCGTQIDAQQLSVDDRNECLSLGLRMNAAGWYHGSFFERNILKQGGPLYEPPFLRRKNRKCRNKYGAHWSFRLVDFGRSRYYESSLPNRQPLESEMAQIRSWWESGSGYWR